MARWASGGGGEAALVDGDSDCGVVVVVVVPLPAAEGAEGGGGLRPGRAGPLLRWSRCRALPSSARLGSRRSCC